MPPEPRSPVPPTPSARAPRRLRGRLAALFALAALGAATAAGAAGSEPSRPDPEAPGLTATRRLDALIERVKWEQRHLTSLEADFEQEKTSEFLAAPEDSHGTISYLRPDRVRWEYAAPKPITLVLDGDEMLIWYRDLGRAERMRVGRVSTQVFHYLTAGGSLESLLGYFSVTFTPPAADEPYRLELKPRYSRIAKRLTSMTLWIDRRLYLPVRVRYVEPNGDSTDYRLAHLRPDVPIEADRFALKLPEGVEVRVVDLGESRSHSAGAGPR
jgi:outer membrane lipoprotein-sorting protein